MQLVWKNFFFNEAYFFLTLEYLVKIFIKYFYILYLFIFINNIFIILLAHAHIYIFKIINFLISNYFFFLLIFYFNQYNYYYFNIFLISAVIIFLNLNILNLIFFNFLIPLLNLIFFNYDIKLFLLKNSYCMCSCNDYFFSNKFMLLLLPKNQFCKFFLIYLYFILGFLWFFNKNNIFLFLNIYIFKQFYIFIKFYFSNLLKCNIILF